MNRKLIILLVFVFFVGVGAADILNYYNNVVQSTNNGSIFNIFYQNTTNVTINGTIGSDNLKVNKSGDTMSGVLDMGNNNLTNTSNFVTYVSSSINFIVNRTYTGTANLIAQFSQSSSVIKFIVTMNDLTGGTNFRVNMNPDQTQQDTTKSGWALVLKPYDSSTGSRFQINRGIPNTTNLEAIMDIWSNDSIYLGDTNAVVKNTKVIISNLSGSGNAYVCVDSTGKLYRSVSPCV